MLSFTSSKRDIAAAMRTNGREQNKVKKFLKMRDFNWKTRARKSVKLLHPITIWAASLYLTVIAAEEGFSSQAVIAGVSQSQTFFN